jgi:hypothetical protein
MVYRVGCGVWGGMSSLVVTHRSLSASLPMAARRTTF